MRNKFLLLSLLVLTLFGVSAKPMKKQPVRTQPVTVNRLAIDVGGAAINFKIGKVDPKRKKIIEILDQETHQVPIHKSIKESGTDIITDSVRHQAIEVIQNAVEKAREFKVSEVAAVAAGSLSQAKNLQTFIKEVAKETGITLIEIDAREEALLSFQGAVHVSGFDPSQLVVWDLGGATAEVAGINRQGAFDFYSNELGSIPFMSLVIHEVKKQNPLVVTSPNPLSTKEIAKAVQLARAEFKTIPGWLSIKMHKPTTKVVGIGALAFLQLEGKPPKHNLTEVKEALKQLAGKTDKQLGNGLFSSQKLTNLALADGMMEEVAFDTIYLYDISLVEGLLIDASKNVPLVELEPPTESQSAQPQK